MSFSTKNKIVLMIYNRSGYSVFAKGQIPTYIYQDQEVKSLGQKMEILPIEQPYGRSDQPPRHLVPTILFFSSTNTFLVVHVASNFHDGLDGSSSPVGSCAIFSGAESATQAGCGNGPVVEQSPGVL